MIDVAWRWPTLPEWGVIALIAIVAFILLFMVLTLLQPEQPDEVEPDPEPTPAPKVLWPKPEPGEFDLHKAEWDHFNPSNNGRRTGKR